MLLKEEEEGRRINKQVSPTYLGLPACIWGAGTMLVLCQVHFLPVNEAELEKLPVRCKVRGCGSAIGVAADFLGCAPIPWHRLHRALKERSLPLTQYVRSELHMAVALCSSWLQRISRLQRLIFLERQKINASNIGCVFWYVWLDSYQPSCAWGAEMVGLFSLSYRDLTKKTVKLCVTVECNQGLHISKSKADSPAKLKKVENCQNKHFCPALLIWCYLMGWCFIVASYFLC